MFCIFHHIKKSSYRTFLNDKIIEKIIFFFKSPHFTWVHFGQVKKEKLTLCKQMSNTCVSGPGMSWFSWISDLNYRVTFTPRCTTDSSGSRMRGDSLTLSFQGNITKTRSNNGTKAGLHGPAYLGPLVLPEFQCHEQEKGKKWSLPSQHRPSRKTDPTKHTTGGQY